MAARSKKEAGQAYLDGILKHIPEAQRAAVKEALSADAVAEAAGEGVLLRDDYSRAMDALQRDSEALKRYHGELQTWYEGEAGKLSRVNELEAEVEKLKSGTPPADPGKGGPPAFDPKQFLSREEAGKLLDQALQTTAGNVSAYQTYLLNLAINHMHEFGQPLDIMALDQRAKKENKRVDILYQEVTKEARDAKLAKAAADHDAEIRKQERERMEEEFRKRAPAMPYPMGNEPSDPNVTLTGIAGQKQDQQFGVQAAVDEFYRMKRPA